MKNATMTLLILLSLGCGSSSEHTTARGDRIIGGSPSDKPNTGALLLGGKVKFGSASCVTIGGKRYILTAAHNFEGVDTSTTPAKVEDITFELDEGGPTCKLDSVYLATKTTKPTSDATLSTLDVALGVPSGCELTDAMCPALGDSLPKEGATCEVYGIRCADALGVRGDADRTDVFVTSSTLSGVFGANGFFLEGLTTNGDSGGVVVCGGVVVGVVRSGFSRDGRIVTTFVTFITDAIAKEILGGTWKGVPLDPGTYEKILARAKKEGVARTAKCGDDAGTDSSPSDTSEDSSADTGVAPDSSTADATVADTAETYDTSFGPETAYTDVDDDAGL